jgi:uncharacterized protein (TIGR02145 family)
MKKLILILVSILLSVNTIFAQDVICILSGEYDNKQVPLDSILVENITKETSILINDLPEYEFYQVNLTQGEFWGTVGINNVTENITPFKILKSTPGQVALGYQKNEPTETLLSIINIYGQKVYDSNIAQINPGNTFNIQLSHAGLYFICVKTKTEQQTFKAIGSDNYFGFSVEIGNYQKSNVSTKSVIINSNNSDFSFAPGDNIRFSVFKYGYYANPISKSITDSENINFQLNSNTTSTVVTQNATDISTFTATLNGEVTDDGGSTVTERGFYFGTSNNVEISGTKLQSENGTVTFSDELSGLQPGTKYYYKAYAINSEGTAYGDEINFTTVATLATVITNGVNNVTVNGATLHAEVTSDGGATITQRGFYWSATNNTPDSGDNIEIVSGTTGEFTFTLTGLNDDTPYYYVAFATNSEGIDTGDPVTFTTNKDISGEIVYGEFTDSRDENTYQIVTIGGKEWMAENLAYDVGDGCWAYNYDENNVATYGRLYTWKAAKAACPTGWHLPTDDEWKQLEMAIGMSQSEADDKYWRGTDEGTKLKAKSGWNNDGNGTNDFGFSGLPGGCRSYTGYFKSIGDAAYWWSSTQLNTADAWCRSLHDDYTNVNRVYSSKKICFSVRCVRD